MRDRKQEREWERKEPRCSRCRCCRLECHS